MLLKAEGIFKGQGRLIFPSLLTACVVLALTTQMLCFWLLVSYFVLVFCCRRWWWLLAAGIFCSFLCLLRLGTFFSITGLSLPPPEELEEGARVNKVVTVLGDTIEINGDRIQFDGINEQHKLRVTVIAKTQKQQQTWRQARCQQLALQLTGKWSKGSPQRNLHGFSYQDYLKNNGYSGTVFVKTLRKWEQETKASLWEKFSNLIRRQRGQLINHVEDRFPPVTASYLKALLFGFKDAAFQGLSEGFQKTGILHLFSLSGMHLVFFFGLLDKGLRRLRLTAVESYVPLCGCLLVGGIIFGGSSSVLRACLFYFVRRTLKVLRLRLTEMDRFAVVLVMMLVIWPRVLLTTGGQLSLYLAWLILLLPTSGKPSQQLVQGGLLTFLPAPFLMYLFGEWSWTGGLLTLVCVPLFSGVLLPGFLLLLILSLAGMPLEGGGLVVIEEGLTGLGALLQKANFASIITGKPELWVVSFCLVASLLLLQRGKIRALILVCIVFPWLTASLPMDQMIAFVDVGQGDSIVLRQRWNQEVTVIDTGGRLGFAKEAWATGRVKDNAESTLIPFLKGEGIRRIDRLILTHGDSDHLGDVSTVLAHFPVTELVIGEGAQKHPNVARLLATITQKTKVRTVTAGSRLSTNFALEVLAPKKAGQGENEDSLVISARMGQRQFLFTGDLDQAGELALLKRYPKLTVDVLKAGHHGSRTASHPAFIATLQVQEAVLSCGLDNRFGHPHQEVLETLAENQVHCLRTDQMGMIYYRYVMGVIPVQPESVISQD